MLACGLSSFVGGWLVSEVKMHCGYDSDPTVSKIGYVVSVTYYYYKTELIAKSSPCRGKQSSPVCKA